MKRYKFLLLVMMTLPFMLTSCLWDDDETVLSDYCYVSSFGLANLKCVHYTTNSEGGDSTYTTALDASYFPMGIDQRNLTIENPDSMPVGTRVDKVLVTVNYNGVLAWRKTVMETAEDSLWTTYSSKDSLDFTNPLHFVCYAEDGSSYRMYTVKLNVHQQNGDTTVWNRLDTEAAKSALQNLGERKAVVWNNALWVFGQQGYATRALSPEGNWATGSLSTDGDLNVQTIRQMNGILYASTTQGVLLRSANGVNWKQQDDEEMPAGYQLVAAGENLLYALHEGSLYSSSNEGGSWTKEELDADSTNLPSKWVDGCLLSQSTGSKRLMLVGNGTDNTQIWSKNWKANEASALWMYYNVNTIDKYRLPLMEPLCVLPYADGMVALGGANKRGAYSHAAMDSLYYSTDFGITWKSEDAMNVDPTLQSLAADAKQITAAVDDQQYIWIVVDDEVWRGRTNRLGFKKQDR